MAERWKGIAFADIKKGDKLRFWYTPDGDKEWRAIIAAVAQQDTVINDYDRDHPEAQYVNVRYEGHDYTNDWRHSNNTVYGLNHSLGKGQVPAGPGVMLASSGESSRDYYKLGEWYQVQKLEEEVTSSKDKALERVKEAELRLAEARQFLEQAESDDRVEMFTAKFREIDPGVFRTGSSLASSMIYFKTPTLVVDAYGCTYHHEAFIQQAARRDGHYNLFVSNNMSWVKK